MTVENTAPAEVETHRVEVTDAAALKARALLDQEGRDDMHLRIEVKPGGCAGLKYSLYFDHETRDGDLFREYHGLRLGVDPVQRSVPRGRGDRLRRHDPEAGLHDRQPERGRLVRLRRQLQLGAGQSPDHAP